MFKRSLSVAALVIAGTAALAPATALAMRCGNQLVLEGYSLDRVEALCGPADEVLPTQTQHYYREKIAGDELAGIAQSVSVDVWIYNGSANQLARSLKFENGRLRKIEIVGKP